MPRSSGGVYTLFTPGNPVVPSTVISSTWANNTLTDLATAMTDSLSRSGDGAMLASLAIVDGNAAGPGLTWGTESASGLYRAGSNDLRFSVSGTDRMSWTGTGVTVGGTLGVSGDATFATNVTITGTQTFTGATTHNGAVTFASTVSATSNDPKYAWSESDAAANTRRWDLGPIAGVLTGRVLSDDGLTTTNFMLVSRSTSTATNVSWPIKQLYTLATDLTTDTVANSFESASPFIQWKETDAAANTQRWVMGANGGQFLGQVVNDAGGTATTWLSVSRTTTTPTAIALTATALTWNGTAMVTLASSPTWTGKHTFTQVNTDGTVQINNATPVIGWFESDQAAGARLWRAQSSGGVFSIQASDDAGSTATSVFDASRSGGTVTGVNFPTNLQYGGVEVGYRPLNTGTTGSTSFSLAQSDNGMLCAYTGTGGHTITCGSLTSGTITTIINAGSGSVTVSASTNLDWYSGSGSIPTGSRTLAVGGICTVRTSGSGNWRIWGAGLS